MELYGTHGTSRSRSKSIETKGFIPGKRFGKAGTGVYFWAYTKNATVARTLALNWWKFCNDKNWYVADPDQRQTVITATITPKADGFLNLDTLEYREILDAVAKAKRATTAEQIANLYDLFISELEFSEKIQIQVVQVTLQIPSVDGERPSALFNHYPSYIVRRDYGQVISNIQTLYG